MHCFVTLAGRQERCQIPSFPLSRTLPNIPAFRLRSVNPRHSWRRRKIIEYMSNHGLRWCRRGVKNSCSSSCYPSPKTFVPKFFIGPLKILLVFLFALKVPLKQICLQIWVCYAAVFFIWFSTCHFLFYQLLRNITRIAMKYEYIKLMINYFPVRTFSPDSNW